MHSKSLHVLVFLLLVPMILISCGMKPAPDNETGKQTLKPRKGVVVFQSPSSGSLEGKATQVLVPSNTDGSQTLVIGSASFYDWMEEVKKTLAREKRENINQACIKLEKIGQDEREALDIDYKVDMECASVPQGEASHTDPSPLDDVDSWVLCQASESGPGSSGPGGDPSGGTGGDPGSGPGSGDAPIGPGGDSGGEPDGGDDQGSGSATVNSLAEILCTPAVGTQPNVDPRLVYPAPDQVEAVVANLAPCAGDFCPFEIIFEVPELDNPTDPIDPSPDDPEDLSPEMKDQLMCDKFRGLCEPDITLISKNDLAKGDDDDDDDDDKIEGKPDGTCDGVCDGVCNKADGTSSPGESCKHGKVGSKDEQWIKCSGTEMADGSICTHHKKEGDQNVYTVTHGNGVAGGRVSPEQQELRETEADGTLNTYNSLNNCTRSSINAPKDQYSSSFTYTCN